MNMGTLFINSFTTVYFRNGIPVKVIWKGEALNNKNTLAELQRAVTHHLKSCGFDGVVIGTPHCDDEDDYNDFWSYITLKS